MALGPATLIFVLALAVVALIAVLEILLMRGPRSNDRRLRKILVVFGTRPEAIKLCPVLLNLRQSGQFDVRVCVTAQHRAMLDQVLAAFDVTPDYDLDLMQPGQTLAQLTARILAALEPVIQAERPDMLLVQGDTTTTCRGALAAFYQHVPVGHVEAGLRTGDLIAALSRRDEPRGHHPPGHPALRTHRNARRRNLLAEGVDRAPHLDHRQFRNRCSALCADALAPGSLPRRHMAAIGRGQKADRGHRPPPRKLRRGLRPHLRSAGPPRPTPAMSNWSIRCIAIRTSWTRSTASWADLANVFLVDPLDYVPFVDLMRRAYLLITDSGGIQEEGPSLGKPILVMREKTERPEAVAAGTVKLVGTDADRIVREAERLLDDQAEYARMARIHNPYGDGRASDRIRQAIAAHFALGPEL